MKSFSAKMAFITCAMTACGCLAQETNTAGDTASLAQQTPMPSGTAKVVVRQTEGRWQLYVNGQPFYIKGAGLEFGDQEKLAAAGGNSFRTWRTVNAQQVLDRALKNGLYVAMGLDVSRERHGFNYSDTNVVAKQLEDMKSQVLQFKDHPALLMWDIGNELNLNSRNAIVWDAVNDISKMIHAVDTNHPTTTSLSGYDKAVIDEVKTRASDLDLLCFQSYGDIVKLQRKLKSWEWNSPYAVTEWGATGHWECRKTTWDAPIEENSSVKAAAYQERYQIAIAPDTANCLGSYVFLWGQKQERTPTWYGMFLSTGESTETVDVMRHIWTGRWPEFRCPQVKQFLLDERTAKQSVHLNAGQTYAARVVAQPQDDSALTYSWEIMEESSTKSVGGDLEAPPQRFPGLIAEGAAGEAQVKAPAKSGAYRLFVYVLGRHYNAGYANIPFYVDGNVDVVDTNSAAAIPGSATVNTNPAAADTKP